jgi:tetratricopeptide (TPR) repeat protein
MVRFIVSLLLVLALGAGAAESYGEAEAAFRAGDMLGAKALLEGLLEAEPEHWDARVLLGYVSYHLGAYDEARRIFGELLAEASASPDAHFGMALTARSLDRPMVAFYHASQAHALAPEREDILDLKEALGARAPALPPRHRPAELALPFTASNGFFYLANGERLVVRGVNLGLALPGKFPADFPDQRELYDEWLALIGAMNANTIRVYTVLPPVFYDALRDYNLAHSGRPLYLLQGVWTEAAEEGDYRGAFTRRFLEEGQRVIDLVHGNAAIAPRAGHTSGTYLADVSPWLLGLIVGREWEPASVRAFNRSAAPRSYRGEHFTVRESNPMEAWLAEVMDRLSLYQLERYHQQTPMAFITWSRLSPLVAPADSRLDPAKITPTPAFSAGHFAAYHAYPYYPDEIHHDPDFTAHPRSSYMAYLEGLKVHHGEQAVLIGEFGVPSSRGLPRLQPQGNHQGGHSEAAQAELNVALYGEIVDSGMAGGVVFAWLDEWFKRHWLFDGLERPQSHLPRWHSVMNPEQNYGLVAFDAPNDLPLGGDPAAREEAEVLAEAGGAVLRAQATPSHLHLLVSGHELSAATFELDTHPEPGPEFLVTLAPEAGQLWINAAYQPYLAREPGEPHEIDAEARPDPEAGWERWLSLRFGPNDADEPGRLRPGADPSGARDLLADYHLGEGGLHLRLPWTLLAVTDPSEGYVFDGPSPDHILAIDGVGVVFRDGSTVLRGRYTWPRWSEPDYAARLKPVYYALKDLWAR